MKLINYQKKKILIHEGLDDAFLKNDKLISCPRCDGMAYYGLYNSVDLDIYEEKEIKAIVGGIKGLEFVGGEIQEYRYKNSSLRVSETKCSNGHDILVVFTYKELQPACYGSYLVGVFDNNTFNEEC
ncbi:hypothetical protein [Pantoea ananatis]|jgi:hypothetical protein|uniref:hypothetical protein n=1 Tax=Pantoea ananas TaxID=553 RepID=UPI0009235A48|nr:hypothetical protein [Pantoea ananatis]MDJ0030602.1 hypothetical protein [Pantoea ananatis]MDJ0043597.1 hypothetical protein [Pantoea ananatis]PQK88318.1 hypothetical protein CG431_02270 [Pantoea ananatis]SFX21354.1 hypothetical protein SAMN03097714_1159 [Pantoea ananatis]